MSYDYITSLPPAHKSYHEFGEIIKSGHSSNKNTYHSSKPARGRGHGPAAIINIGAREQEDVFYIYDRSAKLKKL